MGSHLQKWQFCADPMPFPSSRVSHPFSLHPSTSILPLSLLLCCPRRRRRAEDSEHADADEDEDRHVAQFVGSSILQPRERSIPLTRLPLPAPVTAS